MFEGLGTSSPGVGITQTSFFESFFNFVLGDCLMHKQANYAASFIDVIDLDDFAVGVHACREAVPDVRSLAGALPTELEKLRAAVLSPGARDVRAS